MREDELYLWWWIKLFWEGKAGFFLTNRFCLKNQAVVKNDISFSNIFLKRKSMFVLMFIQSITFSNVIKRSHNFKMSLLDVPYQFSCGGIEYSLRQAFSKPEKATRQ